ncbi:MAG: glycosyltransferase [Sphingobium sp.]
MALQPSVLAFLHSFEPGGVERIALRLIAQWQKADAPVALFMGRLDGAMARQFSGKLRYEHARATTLPVRHFETLWMIFQLAGHVRKTQPDMLFAAGNSYAVVAVALKWLLGRSCPPVVMKISNDLVRPDMWAPYAFLYRLWLRMQGRWIDRFIAMSDALREQIAREMGVAPARIDTIANPSLDMPVSASSRPERNERAGRSFCAVGRLTRQKNLSFMLRAFAAGAHQDDRLTLYGDGPERARLMRLSARLQIAERIHFAGFVPDPALTLPLHDVLLLTSQYEGLPSVVLEAIDAGLHVIATDCCCSMDWLLDHGRLGDLVVPGDTAAFARAIAEAPRGQRNPDAAAAMAYRHRIGSIAGVYLRLFESVGRLAVRRNVAAPPAAALETGFVR